ncbi:MAG: TIGR03936 family radical SAM-associated protein [Defluviitaleaceae bacterium]|nr:TIGR03936 family radical SAM-associated protein [Defluviitaleaceae bacterium]
MHKIRLRFSKSSTLAFIGHLDFLRVFQQTIRRAALPAAFSEGFNPHLKLSFALPLPLGMESTHDYADLTLTDDLPCFEIIERLNRAAPSGLVVLDAYPVLDKAASVVVAADYLFRIDVKGKTLPPMPPQGVTDPLTPSLGIGLRVAEVLGEDSIVVEKKTKKGVRDTDIRGDVLGLEVRGDSWGGEHLFMKLSAGSARFLNPLIVASLVLGQKPCVSAITRLELYRRGDCGGLVAL